MTRTPSWDGLHALRYLGGLPAVRPDGTAASTVHGRVFRAPRLSLLTESGWNAALAAGVRTVVDLRNADEVAREANSAPDGVAVHRLPIEDQGDADFMARFGELLGTPRYYGEVLRRWPGLVVAVMRTVAHAPAGAVVVHCSAGRDRTGQISAMLLALAGVPLEVVADDQAGVVREDNTHLLSHPRPHEPGLDHAALETAVAGLRTDLLDFLRNLDVAAWLLAAGMAHEEVTVLRARLLDPDVSR